uniref:Uncharacterized protein n=1 Tax=Arundo donax TaxID=35708 RepID=A0A0A9GXL1_ARUDO
MLAFSELKPKIFYLQVKILVLAQVMLSLVYFIECEDAE